jgi:hypothetical protein
MIFPSLDFSYLSMKVDSFLDDLIDSNFPSAEFPLLKEVFGLIVSNMTVQSHELDAV